ncbi:CAP domain-containing protein [Sphaerosporella brunnea]|uniref:CAP domain-containing protein n=1 Tax=Sphaerosporella brunnea TaxID=1250544 RepID=A0A5J5F466_9PEZI|nr:CAP domain-containing protein [Sphaerosporella brunnea]
MHTAIFALLPLFLSPATTTSSSTFQTEMLFHHNLLRAEHGSGALIWDDSLEAAAASWAEKCNFMHSQTLGMGENLFCGTNSGWSEEAVCNQWGVRERDLYPYHHAPLSGTGHFTQMVWAGTERVGCAIQWCPDGVKGAWTEPSELVVCNYQPAGNVVGSYEENVVRPCGTRLDGGGRGVGSAVMEEVG